MLFAYSIISSPLIQNRSQMSDTNHIPFTIIIAFCDLKYF